MVESQHDETIKNEFERLGENLRKAVEQAWQSEERKRISEDLKNGVDELGEALNRTAKEFIESPTGQRLSSDVDELSQKVQDGEVTEKVESELMRALNRLNLKLEEVISSMAAENEAEVDN